MYTYIMWLQSSCWMGSLIKYGWDYYWSIYGTHFMNMNGNYGNCRFSSAHIKKYFHFPKNYLISCRSLLPKTQSYWKFHLNLLQFVESVRRNFFQHFEHTIFSAWLFQKLCVQSTYFNFFKNLNWIFLPFFFLKNELNLVTGHMTFWWCKQFLVDENLMINSVNNAYFDYFRDNYYFRVETLAKCVIFENEFAFVVQTVWMHQHHYYLFTRNSNYRINYQTKISSHTRTTIWFSWNFMELCVQSAYFLEWNWKSFSHKIIVKLLLNYQTFATTVVVTMEFSIRKKFTK